MNFNDKFLNVCFKTGKIIFSIFLIIALLITIFLCGKSIYSALQANKVKMEYNYNTKVALEKIMNESDNEFEENEDSTQNEEINIQENKLNKKIAVFADSNKLVPDMKKELTRVVNLIDEKDRDDFFNNFMIFHKDFISNLKQFIKEKHKLPQEKVDKFVDNNINEITSDVYNSYFDLYEKEQKEVSLKKAEKISQRNFDFVAFLVSLGVFALFLFLPILIRIEENTRK